MNELFFLSFFLIIYTYNEWPTHETKNPDAYIHWLHHKLQKAPIAESHQMIVKLSQTETWTALTVAKFLWLDDWVKESLDSLQGNPSQPQLKKGQ